jgi:hypothetical protein
MTAQIKAGDGITIQSDPWFHRGARGVVLAVRVKLMSVAYVNDRGVQRRDVAIDSVTRGHGNVGGRSTEALASATDEMRLEGAKDVAAFGVQTGLLTQETASSLMDSFVNQMSRKADATHEARVSADRAALSAWIKERGLDIPAQVDE